MSKYVIYLETGEEALSEGGYLAHLPAISGCVARGPTKEAAIAKLRETIGAYPTLLRKHGVEAPSVGSVELEIHETEVNTLPSDHQALSDEELERLIGWMEASRSELLEGLADLPADALNWRPDPESWAIRNVLAHIAMADFWYASRLEPAGLPELIWRLKATRQLVIQRLRALPAEERGRTRVHDGEEWTATKVARRVLEHEHEHLDQIRQLIEGYRQLAS